MKRKNLKLWIAFVWIVLSVLSLFVSVVSYAQPGESRKTYALQHLLDGESFSHEVLYQYNGSLKVAIGSWVLTLLCVLGVAAIIAALVGIAVMSKQRPVKWPFVLTLFGVIGTAIPALLILLATLVSIGSFPGTISPGIYPIITPFAVLLCLIIVIQERKRVKLAHQTASRSGLLRKGGDLL